MLQVSVGRAKPLRASSARLFDSRCYLADLFSAPQVGSSLANTIHSLAFILGATTQTRRAL